MPTKVIDADAILKEAQPLTHRHAPEIVSDVIRTNELQVWFVAEHLVDVPLVRGDSQ